MDPQQQPEEETRNSTVSEDILNVIQSGQIKKTSTSNKLSLLMDSSSEEEEEERIAKKTKKPKKKAEYIDSEDDNGGFLSDGYDADFYGDSEDRNRLAAMTEVEREAILYERAQARQARQERRALEQRIKEREAATVSTGKRTPSKEVDLKRKRLDELKAKRLKKLEGRDSEEEEEEGEFDSEEDEEKALALSAEKKNKKKKSRKYRKEDSDEDYYTEEEEVAAVPISKKKTQTDVVDVGSDEEPLDLDMANKLRLSRDIIAQWIYRDGFEEICQKCLLRISLGPGRTGQPIYRVVELKKIVQHHRTYQIKPGTPTNLAALVKFAKNERIFSFEFISNSPFTQDELSFWKMECEKTGVRIPYTNVSARRKIDKLKAFNSEPLSDAVISKMLERRNELHNAPRNLITEQTILRQQLKEALERTNGDENDEEVLRIENELAAISAKRQMTESKDRLAVMDDLNRRNRQVNLETGRQAEISRMQSEFTPGDSNNKNKKAPTLDPFQRRKCKPTIIHMNEAEPVESEAVQEAVKEAPSTAVSVTESQNSSDNNVKDLYDAHNFDLDLEI